MASRFCAGALAAAVGVAAAGFVGALPQGRASAAAPIHTAASPSSSSPSGAILPATAAAPAAKRRREGDVPSMNLAERFAHFASVEVAGERCMTAEDFFASVLVLCGPTPVPVPAAGREVFRLFDDDGDGTISYPEYCMLFTLLSNSERNFRTAFAMFDRDGNGKIDASEFRCLVSALSCDPSVKLQLDGAVMRHFFGAQLDGRLPFATFEKMVGDLRAQLRETEFASVDVRKTGRITLADLRRLVFCHAPHHQLPLPGDDNCSVPRSAYAKLTQVLLKEAAITRGMELLIATDPHLTAKGLSKHQFARALACSGVNLASTDIDILFRLFDADASGTVDPKEFAAAARLRGAFYARHVPDLAAPQRNMIQQFFFCMQQRD